VIPEYIDPNPDQVYFVKYEPTPNPDIGQVVKWGMMELKFLNDAEGYLIPDEPIRSGDYYVVISTGEIHPKEPGTATIDDLEISNLPPGSSVSCQGETVYPEDGTCLLEFEEPGSYVVRVKSPTQLDQDFTVEVE
jgi:hypothetical protein